jgi:hypothetical protein
LDPSAWTRVRATVETILRLAEIATAVIIGRGANLITARLASAFHLRLIRPVQRRVEYMQGHLHLTLLRRRRTVRGQDLGRKRYVDKYYGNDIDDPLLYHLALRPSADETRSMLILGHWEASDTVALEPAARASLGRVSDIGPPR